MLYQLSYARVSHILAPQDFTAAGVLSYRRPAHGERYTRDGSLARP